MGIYMVWPAFYTDVTDSYRLPRRDRLRVDLGGLYFNAIVAVVTLGVWLAWRVDALLLLVALQLLQMVKQLSPMIRADGYHILADATGVPDLYAHIGPTLRRLLPGHRREPSALTGRARRARHALGARRRAGPAQPAARRDPAPAAPASRPRGTAAATIASAIPHEAEHAHVPISRSRSSGCSRSRCPSSAPSLMAQKLFRSPAQGSIWSAGRPARALVLVAAVAAACCGAAWAWWPQASTSPSAPTERGTLVGFTHLVSAPVAAARPAPKRPRARS